VQQLRELIELLRAIRQPVKEHGAALDGRAVLVESRIGARIDRGVRGVACDQFANRVAGSLVAYTRSSRRMRV
jgi:hypothetical protein